jgi:UDP-2,3-diacylglucosamine pyrophosphatase LpxH
VRTLIVSDLHLGNRLGHDVLRRPGPRSTLLEALGDIDRLVLLGDTMELMSRHPWRAATAAEPVLRAIGRELGGEREIILVPGNHDQPLVRAWALSQGASLQPDTTVDPAVTPALGRVVSWLAPARVRVHYPGVWVADGVWATHGHYLDKHLLPESAFGVPRGWAPTLAAFGLPRGRPRARRLAGAEPVVGAGAYELGRRRGRRSREPLVSRLMARPGATLLEAAGGVLRAATVPAVPRLMMDVRLAPVTAWLIDLQMRHASVPAIGRVAQRIGVQADWIVFGHVHRRGPLPGEQWAAAPGGARMLNTGSWLYEPLLVDRATPPHPYWPGGAVLLEPGRDPRSIGLLDDLSAGELTAPPPGVAGGAIGAGARRPRRGPAGASR